MSATAAAGQGALHPFVDNYQLISAPLLAVGYSHEHGKSENLAIEAI
jgi:hypothetical protein